MLTRFSPSAPQFELAPLDFPASVFFHSGENSSACFFIATVGELRLARCSLEPRSFYNDSANRPEPASLVFRLKPSAPIECLRLSSAF
jgi:hypothetical protein